MGVLGSKAVLIFIRISILQFFILLTACSTSDDGGKANIQIDTTEVSFSARTSSTQSKTYRIKAYSPDDVVFVSGAGGPGFDFPTDSVTYEVIQQDRNGTIVDITINPTGMWLGTYTGTLRFKTFDLESIVIGSPGSSTEKNVVYAYLPITLNIIDSIKVDSKVINAYNKGRPYVNYGNVGIDIQNQAIQWEASTVDSWIKLATSSGVGSANLGVDFEIANLTSGHHTGSIQLNDANSDDSVTVDVNLYIDPLILSTSKEGVALSSTSISNLTEQIITVDTSANELINWQVAESAPWLTAIRLSPTEMRISADPTDLANGMYYADITVSSLFNNAEPITVKVGFYVEKTSMPFQTSTNFTATSNNLKSVVDPIRPYLYITDRSEKIYVYNFYTGALVETITNAVAADEIITEIEISDSGEHLYLFRTGNTSTSTVVEYDLINKLPSAEIGEFSIYRLGMEYLNLDGNKFIAMSDGDVFSLDNGALIGNVHPVPAPNTFSNLPSATDVKMAVNNNADVLYLIECCTSTSLYSYPLTRHELNYSITANKLHSINRVSIGSSSLIEVLGIKIDQNDENTYLLSSGIKKIPTTAANSADIVTSQSLTRGNTIGINANTGNVYVGRIFSPDVIVYDKNNLNVLGDISGLDNGVRPNGLQFSSDNERLALVAETSTNNSTIYFQRANSYTPAP